MQKSIFIKTIRIIPFVCFLSVGLLNNVCAKEVAEGSSMLAIIKGLFAKETIHLCPEVKGRIVLDGKPVEGVEILRQLAYNDDKLRKDTTYTDSNGEYYFPEVNIKRHPSRMSITHQQTRQVIIIVDEDKKYRKHIEDIYYRLWNVKHKGTKPTVSFTEKLGELNCDLSDPEVYFAFDNRQTLRNPNKYEYLNSGQTICRWQNNFKIDEVIE